MSDVVNQRKELSGWKQIAGYLQISVRTAQTFEKDQGLPVRRGPGVKGAVFALPADLDQWRTRFENGRQDPGLPVLSANYTTRREWLRYAGFGGSILTAAVGGYAIPKLRLYSNEPPTAYRVEGATLVVLGKGDAELWRYTFSEQLDESSYRGAEWFGPLCVFDDLDGDGRIETVFLFNSKRWEQRRLVCFDSRGDLLWRFTPGKPVVDNLRREFRPPFWPNQFAVLRSKGSKAAKVVVSSHHNWSFPTQVAVLDGKTGRVVSEFWHRGHLLHMAVADLDGDREAEVLLGGVNDAPEYKQATLVIFDPRNITGASKNPKGGTYFQGMAPGTEKAIIFFPRTALSRDLEFNRVAYLKVAAGRITVNVAESTDESAAYIVYEFDFRLRPINVMLSNAAMEMYRLMWRSGALPKESFEAISQRLKDGVIKL